MGGYKNKVVIVTGATGSLGRALCFELARRGSKLALCSTSVDKLKKLAKELSQYGSRVIYRAFDISEAPRVRSFVNSVHKQYHHIDILINNAAMLNAGQFIKLDEKLIEKEIAINYLGPVYMMQAVLPAMGRSEKGQIINISSIVYHRPIPFLSTYSASKAALSALTDSVRSELSGSNIKATNVCLGRLRTGMANYAGSIRWGMDPTRAAQKILDNAAFSRGTIHTHLENWPLIILNMLFPSLLDKLLFLRAKRKLCPNPA